MYDDVTITLFRLGSGNESRKRRRRVASECAWSQAGGFGRYLGRLVEGDQTYIQPTEYAEEEIYGAVHVSLIKYHTRQKKNCP